MRDPYEVLGIQRGATDDEIKKAYRAKCKRWHPDLRGACFSLSLCRGWGLPPPAGPRSAMCRRSDFQTCPGY